MLNDGGDFSHALGNLVDFAHGALNHFTALARVLSGVFGLGYRLLAGVAHMVDADRHLFHRCGHGRGGFAGVGGGAGGLRGLAGQAFGLLADRRRGGLHRMQGGAQGAQQIIKSAGGLRHFILPLHGQMGGEIARLLHMRHRIADFAQRRGHAANQAPGHHAAQPQPQQNQGQQDLPGLLIARYGALIFLLGHALLQINQRLQRHAGVVAKLAPGAHKAQGGVGVQFAPAKVLGHREHQVFFVGAQQGVYPLCLLFFFWRQVGGHVFAPFCGGNAGVVAQRLAMFGQAAVQMPGQRAARVQRQGAVKLGGVAADALINLRQLTQGHRAVFVDGFQAGQGVGGIFQPQRAHRDQDNGKYNDKPI